MAQHQQIQNELCINLVLVLPSSDRQTLHKIRHAKGLRQVEQPHRLLGFNHRNIAIINARELIGTDCAIIRSLHKIEDKWNCQDRDHDHEPVPMLAQKLHHKLKNPFRQLC